MVTKVQRPGDDLAQRHRAAEEESAQRKILLSMQRCHEIAAQVFHRFYWEKKIACGVPRMTNAWLETRRCGDGEYPDDGPADSDPFIRRLGGDASRVGQG
jgi:hypothetical protein